MAMSNIHFPPPPDDEVGGVMTGQGCHGLPCLWLRSSDVELYTRGRVNMHAYLSHPRCKARHTACDVCDRFIGMTVCCVGGVCVLGGTIDDTSKLT